MDKRTFAYGIVRPEAGGDGVVEAHVHLFDKSPHYSAADRCYAPMNSAYRRLLKRVPAELLELMEAIDGEPKLLSYKPGGPGWSADIHVKQRKFRLSSEHGYIAVEEILDNSFRSLMPPPELRTNVSVLQVAELVNAECA